MLPKWLLRVPSTFFHLIVIVNRSAIGKTVWLALVLELLLHRSTHGQGSGVSVIYYYEGKVDKDNTNCNYYRALKCPPEAFYTAAAAASQGYKFIAKSPHSIKAIS